MFHASPRAAGCLLAVLALSAAADGVPIVEPGPALKAGDPAWQLAQTPAFVKLHPIIFSRAAFGANVLTVVIDGKEYRFVGGMMRSPMEPPKGSPPLDSVWLGKDPGGAVIALSKELSTGAVNGTIELFPTSRRFQIASISGSTVLVETDRDAITSQNSIFFAPADPPAAAASAGAQK